MPNLQSLLDALGIELKLPPPRYNIAPTEDVLLLRSQQADMARWWLVPSWAKSVSTQYSMFNARAETLSKSPAFREPYRRQRGIVPMTSFIEWRTENGEKQPWVITSPQRCLAVAALWDIWEGAGTPLLSCTLVTTEAAEAFRPWHTRMPVVLTESECVQWLDNSVTVDPGDPILEPVLKYDLELYPVSNAVGNSGNKRTELFEPLAGSTTLVSDRGK